MVHTNSNTKVLAPEKAQNAIECSEGLLPKTLNSMEIMECHDIEGHRMDKRPTWGRGLEFLMSCLSLSVGLGNIWRFPYITYNNGGAIFVIPYIIILFFIGKPFYFLEMILGQFTSKGSMKAIEVIPLMKGIGWGQQFASAIITTYYTAIIGIVLSYLIQSFSFGETLPWSTCKNFNESCFPAESLNKISVNESKVSSAELFFRKSVLQQKEDISDGIGMPVMQLTLCLLIAWICAYVSIIKGIKTSGKLSYIFAIVPYIIMTAILGFTCTLPGAWNGISYFINPGTSWMKIFEPKVWYFACTQCFFSLTIGMGCIITFSGYNEFNHNIYRDATIVSIMDTLASLLGGFAIFSVLGNFAHNIGEDDISNVVKSSLGLAFITYPEAISKIKTALPNAWFIPQILAIVFFLMLFILGVGSTVGLMNNISTNLKDYFPKIKYWLFALVCSIIGFLIGLFYVTEGGIYIIGLVDYFGGEFLVFALATVELIGVVWIYGLQNICWDVEFMLNRKLSIYWRVCWAVIMPCFMLLICGYLAQIKNPQYEDKNYPFVALFGGWTIFIIGCSQILLCSAYLFVTNASKDSFFNYLISPNINWGPKSYHLRNQWQYFKNEKRQQQSIIVMAKNHSWLKQKCWEVMGKY